MKVAVAAPSAEMALPPVAEVNWAGVTVMAGLVLAGLLPSLRSEAVSVAVPVVLRMRLRLWEPATIAELAGSVAARSLELRMTESVTLLTRFQKGSTALTFTAKVVPTA